MVFTTTRNVEWGDCDAAGIVFYPNYFRWMDASFHEMTRAMGFDQRSLGLHGLHATPLVHAEMSFAAPASHGITLDVAVEIASVGQSSLQIGYVFSGPGGSVASGQESRVCVAQSEERITSVSWPNEIRAMLEHQL